ncbi:hypothetical protein NIES267_25990 [Calothrix parasitica NIES-267]|uniref:Uncharacterized protein n=1 Tax=Calothrix parasitica NIES-267 TaxID=1973488 RepID=A0A1Z4LPH9_9CYAN|nr:hypothetical protein NIES267_25990 [Calothrix parasitica NIES-267]
MNKFELSRERTFNRQAVTNLNVKKLKAAISYFSYLNANGEISDKAFDALVRYACSIFIENEVEILVQETLEEKFIKFLRSKFMDSVEEAEDIESVIYSLEKSRIMRNK